MKSLFSKFYKSWGQLGVLGKNNWILFVAMIVNRMGHMALPFLTLFLTRERGLTAAQAGFVFAIYGIAGMAGAYLSGLLTDRLSPVRVMRLCLLGVTTLIGVFSWLPNYGIILAMTGVWAFFSEGFRPASVTFLAQMTPTQHRKIAFSLHRLAVNLGMSVGPILGGFLAEYSFRGLFLFNAGTTFLCFLVTFLVTKSSSKKVEPPAPDKSAAALSLPRSGFHDRNFMIFLLAVFFICTVYFQHESTLPIFMDQVLHLAPRFYGLAFTINTLLIVFFEIPLNVWTSHLSHRFCLGVGASFYALGFGILAFAKDFWIVAVAVVLWTVGEMIESPAMHAKVADLAPPKKLGEYMGMQTMCFSLAFSLGPWLGSVIFQEWGSEALWAICFVVGLGGAAIFARLPSKERNFSPSV